jgi:uncharacterized protein (TIGR02265 family)
MLWKAVELLAPRLKSADAAFEQLGLYTMDALLRSPFGRSLEDLKAIDPAALFKPLLTTLNPMLAPGQRVLLEATLGRVKIALKEEVLPIQVYVGLFRSLCLAFYGVELSAAWEKPAAQRIELTLTW